MIILRFLMVGWIVGGALLAGNESRPLPAADPAPADNLRLGAVDFASSGHPDAQPHFRRGVAALHSFWYPEALAAFQAALAMDPGYAMAWWGVAMCYNRPYLAGSNDDAGRRALARIGDISGLTPRERAYIDALRAFYAEGTSASRTVAYAAAMEKVHGAYREDLDAAAFHSLSLLGYRWSSEEDLSRQEKAGAIATEVYRRNPNHPGAAHYIIHSFDEPALAGRALTAARHYAGIAPDAPHALHMPSHIFLQLGMWPDVVASNEAAWAASEAWVRRRRLAPAFRDYHNYHWLIYACLQQGRQARAAELVDSFRAMRNDIPPLAMHYLDDTLAAFIVETRCWERTDDLLVPRPSAGVASAPGAPESPPAVELCGGEPPGSLRRATADVRGFIRAFAAAARDAPAAARLRDELRAAATGDDANAKFWRVRLLMVSALISARAQAFEPAIAALSEATRLDEELGRSPGPPSSFKPAHELFGEVLLAAGRPAEAAAQFDRALVRHPNRPFSLIGRARAESARGDPRAAVATYSRFLRTWDQADRDRPELREAQDFLRVHGA